MKTTMKTTILAGFFAGALAFSGSANAFIIDFTDTGWIGAVTKSQTFGGLTVTVSSNGAILNADTLFKQNAVPCIAPLNLACVNDGIGIGTRDDEVTFSATVGTGEILNVSFSQAVTIDEIGFLDLFTIKGEPTETASWKSNGGPVGSASAQGTDPNNPGQGWLLATLAQPILGVTTIDFFTNTGTNSDFALALLNISDPGGNLNLPQVPLPASAYLFGTGLLGLGFLARRRRKKNQVKFA